MFVHRRSGVNGSGVTALSRTSPVAFRVRELLFKFGRRRFLRDLLLVLLVALASVFALRDLSRSQPFSIDESRWIATSRYFWITFVDRDIFGPAWQPNYLVYTHPPVARYLIGFGLWLQGWSPDQLNGRYDSLQSRAYNDRAGNIPDLELLWAARRVTFVFAIAAVTLVYLVARKLGGVLAGLAAVAFVLVNPLLTTVWTRALAESIVATFSLLALALALRTMPYVGVSGSPPWLPLAVGGAISVAAATKLNGTIGAIGMGVFAMIQQFQSLVRTRRTAGLRAWVDVALTAIVVFVVVNPLLYVNPAERIVGLVQHRQDEMEFQRSVFTLQAVPEDLWLRVHRVIWRAFESYATPPGLLPISPDLLLVTFGVGLLAWRSINDFRRGWSGPSFLFLCWLVATYAIVTPNLGFDSSHYFAPLVALNTITIGVVVEATFRALARPAGRLRGVRSPDASQNVQAPVK
jgi:hypothetical protein